MPILDLDFETYYDTEYSLRRMTTLEYVMDPRFKAHMMGFKWLGEVKPSWSPESGVLGPDEIAPFLARVDWSETAVVGHNLMFDACILRWRYGITTCRQWFDTLGMARYVIGALLPSLSLGSVYEHVTKNPGKTKAGALNDMKGVRDLDEYPGLFAKGAAYCMDDINETATIFEWLLAQFPVGEWIKMHWCLDMWLNPKLRLNEDVLRKVIADEQDKKVKLVAKTGLSRTAISSNQQFAAYLETLGVTVPKKISKTTGKPTVALAKQDQDFDELRGHDDERVRDAVEARLAVKSTIDETRAERLLTVSRLTGGWLPVPLNYCGAMQTGRLSGCLTGDTQILVVDPIAGMCYKSIVDVQKSDLVWDGEDFVEHEGVKFSGYREVVEHDGVKATPEHVVFTESGDEKPISQARADGDRIQSPPTPTRDQTLHAWRRARRAYYETDDPYAV